MYRKNERQLQKENVTINLEALVPENHLFRLSEGKKNFFRQISTTDPDSGLFVNGEIGFKKYKNCGSRYRF